MHDRFGDEVTREVVIMISTLSSHEFIGLFQKELWKILPSPLDYMKFANFLMASFLSDSIRRTIESNGSLEYFIDLGVTYLAKPGKKAAVSVKCEAVGSFLFLQS